MKGFSGAVKVGHPARLPDAPDRPIRVSPGGGKQHVITSARFAVIDHQHRLGQVVVHFLTHIPHRQSAARKNYRREVRPDLVRPGVLPALTLIAGLVFGEKLTSTATVGMALAVGGVYLVARPAK